jgi:uncharacterized damage-inducible protein DinB
MPAALILICMTNSSLSPEQAALLFRTIFLPALQREHATTKTVIAAIPPSRGDYRPEPVAKTAMELAWHIASAEKRFLEFIINGQFSTAAINRPDSVSNSADVARWYGETFQSLLEQLQKLPPEQLARIIDFRGFLQQPAVTFLQTMMHHSAHHRGQLSTYLRPMGGKVPAIYGESYDSAEAKKSAQAV